MSLTAINSVNAATTAKVSENQESTTTQQMGTIQMVSDKTEVQQKKPEKENLTPQQKAIQKDLASGLLTREKSFWTRKEYLVYHTDRAEELKRPKLTYGQIKERYGIPDGVLTKDKENDIYQDSEAFGSFNYDERGKDLDKYYPGELGPLRLFSSPIVRFPVEAVKKQMEAIDK